MKLYITGGPGSGKTFLSRNLSKKYNINLMELDDIFWDNEYKMENEDKRNNKLKNFLDNNKEWIIEGTYYDWLTNVFEQCDKIIFINSNSIIRDYRIISRFIVAKFDKNNKKKENIKNLIHMISWNHNYENKIKNNLLNFIKPFENKFIFLKDKNKIQNIEKFIRPTV